MTDTTALLLAAAYGAPLVLALACAVPGLRRLALALAPYAPVPALLAALDALTLGRIAARTPLLGLNFYLDAPGAVLMAAAAALWIAAGVAAGPLRAGDNGLRFTIGWLLTLAGGMGVFAATDLVTFYFVFALVSLPAYVLITHDGSARALRAGVVAIAFALFGEAILLLGLALLAAGEPSGSLYIADVMAALPDSPFAAPAVALTVAGLAMKMALPPMHGYLPLAYTAAPPAAAAALSAAGVNAGVIGLIRFVPFETGLPGLSEALTAAGLFAAFYGVALGLLQRNPKTILAYSSVSQMGVLAAVVGMGLSAEDPAALIQTAFYGANHLLVKGALFLGVGAAAARGGRRVLILAPAILLALNLGGLPLTGGGLAKLAVKDTLGSFVVGWLAAFSAAGTTLLMLHFAGRLASVEAEAPAAGRRRAELGWFSAVAAAVFLPYLFFPIVGQPIDAAFAPAALVDGLWPVLLGAALAFALRRAGDALPHVPPGDLVVVEEAGVMALARVGAMVERAEYAMRRWPAAAMALVALIVAFGVAFASG
ncbi:proton-conducting transporter membrane subunit [Methylocella sp.]|uniref:proton-conducting transporter transmembrane domain-containing protein n=1 Tax=Methylocella sp. TaxID=1978226 RepID=UPI003784A494